MFNVRKLALLLFILSLQSCATSTGSPFQQAANSKEGYGVLYIYSGERTVIFTPSIIIDGNTFCELQREGFCVTRLLSGVHNIYIDWPLFTSQPGVKFDIDIQNEGTQYVKVGDYSSINPTLPLLSFKVGHLTTAGEVPKNIAIPEISKTKLIKSDL